MLVLMTCAARADVSPSGRPVGGACGAALPAAAPGLRRCALLFSSAVQLLLMIVLIVLMIVLTATSHRRRRGGIPVRAADRAGQPANPWAFARHCAVPRRRVVRIERSGARRRGGAGGASCRYATTASTPAHHHSSSSFLITAVFVPTALHFADLFLGLGRRWSPLCARSSRRCRTTSRSCARARSPPTHRHGLRKFCSR